MTLIQLAERLGLEQRGEDVAIHGVAPLESATRRDLSFVAGRKWLAQAGVAGAIIVTADLADQVEHPCLISPSPAWHLAQAAKIFGMRPMELTGISPDATIHPTAILAEGVAVGPRAVIGAQVTIGKNSQIHAGAVIHAGCIVGANCVIQSNTVIGADGYGYEMVEGVPRRIDHFGIVRIEDDVEIGAGTTIDRARFGETLIRTGTKIDNLVQIAHNVQVGRYVMIVSQVGISGSCRIEDGAILAGQAGLVPHVTVGKGARVAAGTGVATDVPEGITWSGWWGQEHRRNLTEINAIRKLPEFMKAVRKFMDRFETK